MGSGGTGSFASGPITGFGSIVVGGVHFDESAARIENDDGTPRDRAALHLGTMVEVDSDEIRGDAATASQVRITSALIGAVESVAADALVVNGLTVRIEAGTVFDERVCRRAGRSRRRARRRGAWIRGGGLRRDRGHPNRAQATAPRRSSSAAR